MVVMTEKAGLADDRKKGMKIFCKPCWIGYGYLVYLSYHFCQILMFSLSPRVGSLTFFT